MRCQIPVCIFALFRLQGSEDRVSCCPRSSHGCATMLSKEIYYEARKGREFKKCGIEASRLVSSHLLP